MKWLVTKFRHEGGSDYLMLETGLMVIIQDNLVSLSWVVGALLPRGVLIREPLLLKNEAR